jgi:5,10-methylenetetrahydromethanopterin reductase
VSDSVARFGLGVSNCRPVDSIVKAIQSAEDGGAEVAFIAEDVNCRDAFLICSLAARATSRIKLATGVVNPYTRNPTSLAMAVATLDEISGGRALLGLGTSSPSLIEGQMGIKHESGILVLKEAAEIIQRLLAGEAVTYSGKHFRYQGARLRALPAQVQVPLFFAAMGPQTLRLAGRIADGVLLNVGASTTYVRWAVGEVRKGAIDANRDPASVTIAAWLTAYVVDNYDDGVQRAREWLATMLSVPAQGELLLRHGGEDDTILGHIREQVGAYPHTGDSTKAATFVPPEVAARLALIGDASVVAARVQEYREAGIDIPVLGPGAIGTLYPK